MELDQLPKVTVLVMTYNHERFIVQALDSVLMQQTNFHFEVVISEDCSTDQTRTIILSYYKRFPDKIRLILSEHNLHNNQIVVRGIKAARGAYIALLDGDDYWTAVDKLQQQVDLLDSHSECSLCFHNAMVIDEDGRMPSWKWTPLDQKPFSTLEDLWLGNFIATCSTMFRKGAIQRIPTWYDSMFPITDWPLHILNAEQGKIGYIDQVMGVYRYHAGGYYSPLSEAQKLSETLKYYRRMDRNLNYRYTKLISIAISKYFFEWAQEYATRGNWTQAKVCFQTCISNRPINKYIGFRELMKLGIRLYLPGVGVFERNNSA